MYFLNRFLERKVTQRMLEGVIEVPNVKTGTSKELDQGKVRAGVPGCRVMKG